MIKIYLKETIEGYTPIPNNLPPTSLKNILLNKLQPYENVFLQIYEELPKKYTKNIYKKF